VRAITSLCSTASFDGMGEALEEPPGGSLAIGTPGSNLCLYEILWDSNHLSNWTDLTAHDLQVRFGWSRAPFEDAGRSSLRKEQGARQIRQVVHCSPRYRAPVRPRLETHRATSKAVESRAYARSARAIPSSHRVRSWVATTCRHHSPRGRANASFAPA
jgi:hypothetical protein